MGEPSVEALERLARWMEGDLNEAEKAAFDAELRATPELQVAHTRLLSLDRALPELAGSDSVPADLDGMLERALQPATPARRPMVWPAMLTVALAAVLAIFIWSQGHGHEVEAMAGVVVVDARTLMAGDRVTSGDHVVTSEIGVAVSRHGEAARLMAPSSEAWLVEGTLQRGAVVLQGTGSMVVRGVKVEVTGEAVLSTEPIEGTFRETGGLAPGDLVDSKKFLLVSGTIASAVLVYVLQGEAVVTPPGEEPASVRAGQQWVAAQKATTARARPTPGRSSSFEQWPSDPKPSRETIQLPAAQPTVEPGTPGTSTPPSTVALAVGLDAGVLFKASVHGIEDAMMAAMPDIQDCYEKWLQQRPDLSGRLVLGFSLGADDAGAGEISGLQVVDGGLGHALMEGCVKNSVQNLRFEAPDEPFEVHYPLMFESVGYMDGGP